MPGRSKPLVIAPLIPCLMPSCKACRSGHFVRCKYSFIGTRIHGALAEYVEVPAANLIPLSENVDARRRCALVRDVDDVDFRHQFELLHPEVVGRTVARRSVGEATGPLPGKRDEFADG